jgi:phosphoadenosine phosphosulfate reductase
MTTDTKIALQVLVSPLLHWSDTLLWLMTLSHEWPINAAYRRGFDRVGCLPCPFNSRWSDFLHRQWYPLQVEEWHALLIGYARRAGKPDPREHVVSGAWKARAGGRHVRPNAARLARSTCTEDPTATSYTFEGPWHDRFWRYLVPFGTTQVLYEDGLITQRLIRDVHGEALAIVRVSRPRSHVRVNLLVGLGARLLLQRLERQFRKFQLCQACGACAAACPTGAIDVASGYHIDESRCTHCLWCVTKIKAGCIVANTLTTT